MPTPAEEARMWGFDASCPGIAHTIARRHATQTYVPATGVLQMSAIYLPQGAVVTTINMVTGATGVTANLHVWVALYRQGLAAAAGAPLVLMAQSTDDTGGTQFAANTAITKSLTAAQTCPYSGLYYIGYMQAVTTTVATICCAAGAASNILDTAAPMCGATADTGLTATAPTSPITLVTQINNFYAYVT